MTIKRTINGTEIEIELTEDEIEKAYRQQERKYYANDVYIRWSTTERSDISREEIERDADNIVDIAIDIMSCNDIYWEGYWDCFDRALDEYANNPGY